MEENEKQYSRWQWFFYIIFVPFLFSIALVGLIFTFLGYNVVDSVIGAARNLPVVSSMVEEEPEENEPSETQAEDERTYSTAEWESVQQQLEEKDQQMEQLIQEIEELKEQDEQQRITREERMNDIRELARLYEGMSSSKAAAIIENLSLKEAATIIEQMNPQQQTSIMAKLDPTFAAQLTVTIKELNLVDDPDMAALQERVHLLMGLVDDEEEAPKLSMHRTANTLGQLPPAQAAAILEDMSQQASEFDFGLKLLIALTDEKRSGILSVMEADVARRYMREMTQTGSTESD